MAPGTAFNHDDIVRTAARGGAPDRYLAALLAPKAVRRDLIALAAFAAEIDKISDTVSEPHLGEIRLQWWRDALAESGTGAVSGQPVCDALARALNQHGLRPALLDDSFDAEAHALYADAPADEAHLALSLDMTEGTLFKLAARIAGATAESVAASHIILHHAAQAYGLTRRALRLPYALQRGREPLPAMLGAAGGARDWTAAVATVCARARQHLAHVRTAYRAEPRAIQTALLPIALVEPYLRALSDPTHTPDRDIADIAPLTRTWRLAKTHVLRRI